VEETGAAAHPGGGFGSWLAKLVGRWPGKFERPDFQEIKLLAAAVTDSWSRHKAPRLGASLAFHTLLSIAPMLIIVIAVAGLLFGREAAQGQLYGQIQSMVGPAGARAIEQLIEGARRPAAGILASAIGLVTLFLGATSVVVDLRDALNTIWEAPSRNGSTLMSAVSFLKDRLRSFLLVVGVGFVLLLSLVVNTWLAAAGSFVTEFLRVPEVIMQSIASVLSLILGTLLFAMVYKILPDVFIEWRDVVLGAAVTSLLFTLGRVLISLYLGKTSVASSFGAAGSLVAVLVWVYYSAQVFFLGAEFTHVFAERYGSRRGRRRPQP